MSSCKSSSKDIKHCQSQIFTSTIPTYSTGFRSDNESTSSWLSWSTRRFMMQLRRILSMTVSSSLTPAVAGYDRPTLTPVVFHGLFVNDCFRFCIGLLNVVVTGDIVFLDCACVPNILNTIS